MKILLCSWANIFEPEINYAFKKMGFTVDELISFITDPFSDSNYIRILSDKLLTNTYAFVFSVNYIPIVTMVCTIHKIKYISWIADSPCFELNSYSISSPYNYIFIFDKILFDNYYTESPDTVYYLPLGSNVARLDNIVLTNEENINYKSDISFVGSLYTFRSKYNNLYRFDKRNHIIDNFIGRECSHRERIRIINRLCKEFSFDLYTNDDTSYNPGIKNNGIVDPIVEVFKVYKATKINLNITSKTIKSGLPLRLFDIMGSGGFLITNYQSELSDYFEINKDLVVYENSDDLVNKISYYLSHEDERLEIAYNGYTKVKTKHQFTNRICKILSFEHTKYEFLIFCVFISIN
ncbi:MAG: DUF3880 domain-containing protein [Lachnotalea sp.]